MHRTKTPPRVRPAVWITAASLLVATVALLWTWLSPAPAPTAAPSAQASATAERDATLKEPEGGWSEQEADDLRDRAEQAAEEFLIHTTRIHTLIRQAMNNDAPDDCDDQILEHQTWLRDHVSDDSAFMTGTWWPWNDPTQTPQPIWMVVRTGDPEGLRVPVMWMSTQDAGTSPANKTPINWVTGIYDTVTGTWSDLTLYATATADRTVWKTQGATTGQAADAVDDMIGRLAPSEQDNTHYMPQTDEEKQAYLDMKMRQYAENKEHRNE